MEIDPVILQLRADLNGYLSQLRSTTNTVDKLLGSQEAKARQLEAEMKRSSGAIAGYLRNLAGAFGAAFGAREVFGMIDGYTRLQNALKVAGLEGENLAQVQSKLVDIGGRYGVSVNALAGLYGNSSQTAKELGASQAQLLQITEATAQALKITGTSTEQAQGAILGLTQALASGTVRAEEFNQINEGGLRPLLQAAAASEKFGGSIAKLRTEVLAGNVSSQEFFSLMLQGAGQLENTAAKSVLTLAGAFQSVQDKVMIYVGSAASAEGVTGALAASMKALADNLDTIIPALATIGALMGARYVVATGAAAAATFTKAAADVRATQTAAALAIAEAELAGMMGVEGLAARNAAAAVTTLSVAQGVAARSGSALLATLGGPVGAAILAVAAAVYVMHQRVNALREGTGAYRRDEINANDVRARAEKAVNALASATGKAREAALKNTEAVRAETAVLLANAKAELERAKAKAKSAAADAKGSVSESAVNFAGPNPLRPIVGMLGGGTAQGRSAQAKADVAKYEGIVAGLEKDQAALDAAINGSTTSTTPAGSGGKTKGPKGPTPEEIAARVAGQMEQLSQQMLSAEESMAKTAEARASLAIQAVNQEAEARKREVLADADYSDAQKAAIVAQIGRAAEIERSRIEFAKQVQLEQEAAAKAQAQFDAARDALQAQYELADTQDERRRIALEMVDAEYHYLRSVQEAIIASATATAAEKERARIIRDSLDAQVAGRQAMAARANESPLETWARQNGKGYDTQARAEEAVVAELETVRNGIHNALSKAIGVKDPLISFLLDSLLQELIFKPLAEAIGGSKGGGGGGGGGLVSAIASVGSAIFGRASGGRVNAGQVYRVNEAASPGNVELFRPDVGGQIIPLGRTSAVQPASQGQGAAVVRVELAGDIDARIEQVSGPIAVEVFRAAAPSIIDASANETMRRAQRPRI